VDVEEDDVHVLLLALTQRLHAVGGFDQAPVEVPGQRQPQQAA
jgi:hypothetical protein